MKTYLENERGARGENIRASVCAARMLSLRQNKDPSFPGHAPGKDTLRAANAATKEGANGGENGLSEAITRCRPRQNKDSRRVGGHAPPQRHLKRSAATTKTRFTGRKQPNELLAK